MDLLLSFITTFIASILCLLLFRHLAWIRNRVNRNNRGLVNTVPEAAGSWPIIGHLHLLAGSQVPHKVLSSMADEFGPIFTIKLGVNRVLIVNDSEMAKECLTINDRVFASRPKSMASELIGYNYANFALAPYGSYWREIRKIFVLELASQHRLQTISRIQASELKSSITDLYKNWMTDKASSETIKVDMKKWFGNLILNMTVRAIFGNRFSHIEQNGDEFKIAIRRFSELLGAFVPSDAIPALRWLDIGGYEKNMKKIAKVLDVKIEGWLQEHIQKTNSTQQKQVDDDDDDEKEDQLAFMSALLAHVKELNEDLSEFSTDTIIKATCLAFSAAAIDTTTVTLTWALALLINNPNVLKKAQQELENKVGLDRMVNDSDLPNLVYLQAIIKETMRLYPPAPLSVPRESTQDCIVGGYNVPIGTRLLVNIWKIHHDPRTWEDPFEFRPERFLTSGKEIDVKGQHFELIPFGSGRRVCLGISVALKSVELILASVIHGFEFKNPSSESVDMTESRGLTNLKATPLELLVAPRILPDLA